MDKLDRLALRMIAYDSNDPKRIQHFLKVHSLCHIIGVSEGLEGSALTILEAAGYVHDIGIRAAEQQYGYQNGKLQEELGPAVAEKMLRETGFDEDMIQRICYLVGHHHSYTDVQGLDYRILIEADWLVNNYEYSLEGRDIYAGFDTIFRTKTGKALFGEMFGEP